MSIFSGLKLFLEISQKFKKNSHRFPRGNISGKLLFISVEIFPEIFQEIFPLTTLLQISIQWYDRNSANAFIFGRALMNANQSVRKSRLCELNFRKCMESKSKCSKELKLNKFDNLIKESLKLFINVKKVNFQRKSKKFC